jgi:hypothetical protein
VPFCICLGADEVGCSAGASRLEISSPSSARRAIGCPTAIPDEPSAFYEYNNITDNACERVTPRISSEIDQETATRRERLAHEDFAQNTILLGLDVHFRLVRLDREEDVASRKRLALVDLNVAFQMSPGARARE